MFFYQNYSYKGDDQPALAVIEFPMSYFEAYKPVSMQIKLPIRDAVTEDDLDMDMALQNWQVDPNSNQILQQREQTKSYLLEPEAQVLLSM